jgi:branched-chain amino acid transport system substrate-binding protein
MKNLFDRICDHHCVKFLPQCRINVSRSYREAVNLAATLANLIAAGMVVIGLAACQPATLPSNKPLLANVAAPAPSSKIGKNTAGSSSLEQPAPLSETTQTQPDNLSEMPKQDDATEMAAARALMDTIIWEFQGKNEKAPVIETPIPVGKDPSLGDDALEAAFALLSSRVKPLTYEPVFEMPPKADGVIRVGLLVPLSGEYAALGAEIRQSVEMALFKINNPKIEVLFLDTKAGEAAGNAAMTGIENDVDIFIGPLFTEAVKQARVVIDQVNDASSRPPMLLLSNNVDVAGNDRWLLGYLPEQQLDGLLGHAVSAGKRRFALIGQNSLFGQRLLNHASQRLADFGLKPEAVRVLSDGELADETNLKNAIRDFTRYVPPVDDAPLPDSPFDAVIFAGDPAFALRTAPVLAYYDVGPDRALYLGNALWNQQQLLGEPSLQGALFSTRPSNLDLRFDADWKEIWPEPAGQLARVGFDAMALVAALAKSADRDWAKQLVTNSGFQGYSGAFRLLPNGRNVRSFELRKIDKGQSKIIRPAPNRI